MDENLNKPQVSIMMLSYNRAKYIGTAIESVLNQTFVNWELLILDGGSRDNSHDVISQYLRNPRIKFIKQPENISISKHRNDALKIAGGKYVAVLDSDDVWIDSEKLEKQFNFLEKNSDYVLVGSNFERIDENGRAIKKITSALTDTDIRKNLLFRNEFAHSSVMYKVSALRQIPNSGYDETLPVWEDYDLWLRLGQIGKLANLADFTTAYRVHRSSISKEKKIRGAVLIMKIISRYRNSYPNFYLAYLKALLRLLARAIGL
jgi:glycosyltransferase involved in cell wall biosynthesis